MAAGADEPHDLITTATDGGRESTAPFDPASRPLILVISQVYVPDPASVGQHMADAAEELASRGYRVVVLTSARGYEDPTVSYPRRETRAGVEIVRLPLSSFGKKSFAHRVVGQLLFLLQVIARGLMSRRLSGILVSTSPPMAGFAAIVINLVRRTPITYWLMDLNPDQAVALHKVAPKNPLVSAMRWLNRRIFSRAANVIVLDRYMAERVQEQYRVNGSLSVLPPWPHEQNLDDVPTSDNPFRAEHNPDDRFIIMYSGNHSPASPVTTLLEAARRLRDDPRYLFLFVGGGAGKREVDEVIARERPPNVRSLPYQPLNRLSYSLSAADLHVTTLGNNMVGIIHPCKIYGAMAVGRPVLYIGPRPSHAADLISTYKFGEQVDHCDVDGVVRLIQKVADAPLEARREMGRRGAAAIAHQYSKEKLCNAFCDVVVQMMRSKGPLSAGVSPPIQVHQSPIAPKRPKMRRTQR